MSGARIMINSRESESKETRESRRLMSIVSYRPTAFMKGTGNEEPGEQYTRLVAQCVS